MTTQLQKNKIEDNIYSIRGQQVLLDSDLAELYQVKTKVLNQAVRRNQARFPGEDFMFQLIQTELDVLKSQFITIKNRRGRHRKHLPTAFTEHGVAMLSGILNSDQAIAVNIAVVRAFVKLRKAAFTSTTLIKKVDHLEQRIDQYNTDTSAQISAGLNILRDLHTSICSLPESSLQQKLEIRDPPHQPIPSNQDFTANSASALAPTDSKKIADQILAEVAEHFCLDVNDLFSHSRLPSVVLPRQICMYLMRNLTNLGFREIGSRMGGRDHTTALHAYRKIAVELLSGNFASSDFIRAIQKRLRS